MNHIRKRLSLPFLFSFTCLLSLNSCNPDPLPSQTSSSPSAGISQNVSLDTTPSIPKPSEGPKESLPLVSDTASKDNSDSEPHVHVFDQEVVSPLYLAFDATCTEPALYFYSCVCGERGTETFAYGEPLGHELLWYYGPSSTNPGQSEKWIGCSRGDYEEEHYAINGKDVPYLTYQVTQEHQCVITGFLSEERNVNLYIPEFIDDYFVTGIADYAFMNCTNLVSVTLPEIDDITPVSLISIGSHAFEGCSSLKSINLPSTRQSLGSFCFKGCTSLASLSIPDSVVSIGQGITAYCSNRTSLNYVNGDLFTSYYTPEGSNCIIDNKNNSLIAGCSSSTIPSDTKAIGDYAFAGRKDLTSVILPEGLLSIGHGAFLSCSGLTTLYIPSSVESIYPLAFGKCSALTSRSVDESNTHFDSRNNCNAIIRKDDHSLIAGISSSTIPEGVSSIASHAFDGQVGLTQITIPDSVKTLGDSAFYDCTSLKKITNAVQVSKIGDSCFYGCSSLESIKLPGNIKVLSSSAFEYCSSLTSVTLPDTLSRIGAYAFASCRSLNSIVLPNLLEIIGYGAFEGCSSLTARNIPSRVSSIGLSVFAGCTSLTSLTVNSGNAVYDSRENCNAIIAKEDGELISGTKATIVPSSVKAIGPFAFAECSPLSSIVLPEGINAIGYYAFANCFSLSSVSLPESVTSIGRYAFFNCYSRQSIVLPKSILSIATGVFSDCRGLTDVYYTGSEEEWDNIVVFDENEVLDNVTFHYSYIRG